MHVRIMTLLMKNSNMCVALVLVLQQSIYVFIYIFNLIVSYRRPSLFLPFFRSSFFFSLSLAGAPPEQPSYFSGYIEDIFCSKQHTRTLLDLINSLDVPLPEETWDGSFACLRCCILTCGADPMTGPFHGDKLATNCFTEPSSTTCSTADGGADEGSAQVQAQAQSAVMNATVGSMQATIEASRDLPDTSSNSSSSSAYSGIYEGGGSHAVSLHRFPYNTHFLLLEEPAAVARLLVGLLSRPLPRMTLCDDGDGDFDDSDDSGTCERLIASRDSNQDKASGNGNGAPSKAKKRKGKGKGKR